MFKKIILSFMFIILFVIPSYAAGNVCPVCTATWNANVSSEQVIGYKLYMSTTSGTEGTGVIKDVGNVLTSTLSTTFTLVSGTQYYITVTAYNIAGESSMSNEVPFIFVNTKPSTPTGLIVK
jgi:hypothetical protein